VSFCMGLQQSGRARVRRPSRSGLLPVRAEEGRVKQTDSARPGRWASSHRTVRDESVPRTV
jgi:hypothetical protein